MVVFKRNFTSLIWLMFATITFTLPALAHAFGSRHQLEAPLYYYMLGAGLTVTLSFIIAVWLVRAPPVADKPMRGFMLMDGAGLFKPLMKWTGHLTSASSLFIFVLILAAGFWGPDSPTRNFAPIFIWSLWWVGIVIIQVLGFDIWQRTNPWVIIHQGICSLIKRDPEGGFIAYPERLSCWPAVLLFWGFAWLEQISSMGEIPSTLSVIILIYSAITWLGMALFGRKQWLENGEVFSILFGYLGSMAPLLLRSRDENPANSLWLRYPMTGLLERPAPSRAATSLLLLFLASVTFDGFRDTASWEELVDWALTRSWLYGGLLWVQQQGIDLYIFLETTGLILTPILFFITYSVVSAFSAKLVTLMGAGQGTALPQVMSGKQYAGLFIVTLLPISFAYHIAHYFSFLLLAGQLAVPTLSDPLGLGWNLLGVHNFQLNVGVIGVSTTWWLAMGAVIIGHIYAVYLAHIIAIRSFKRPWLALVSQLPLVTLMIFYTMISLWILAQPIVAVD